MTTLLWILWFFTINQITSSERSFRVKLTEFSVKYKDTSVVRNAGFRITELNNRSYVNGELSFKSDVPEIDMRTTMDFWKHNNTKRKFKLYDVRVDACLFLRTVHRNSLFNIYVKSFKKHTNANLVCPLKKNFNYTLNNWFMEENDLPVFIPLGTFRTISEYFLLKRKLGLRIETYGQIYPYP
ncbi:uncharacterized protein Dana_GF20037 [Drosophila ananassae]|uniref:Uncharacterized protein n=1 Tax=Drosophila ananassae TaxID=7217 RepID=B3MVC4_DROAN|nr:uncharacterized protein LOC6502764 [Drosophila ananassae]EDV33189.1 uncharacterized protein Dana_GF20037 [Drosophila ananassae]